MRLRRIMTGHAPRARLKLFRLRLMGRVDDIDRTLMYRPELFGRPFMAALQSAMREPSRWSVGERELFAAFTSSLNQCPF